MLLLLDKIDLGSRLLYASLRAAGYDFACVCVNDDGFLPEGIASPYAYYVNREGGEAAGGAPLFFDRLRVPPLWEIRGNGAEAFVYDYNRRRARVFYAEPREERHVKVVDWLDEDGRARFSDHYDSSGKRFATTVLDRDGRPAFRSYFDRSGAEAIYENYVSGAICVNDGGRLRAFRNRSSFVIDYLKRTGAPLDRILYNSLSTPLFCVDALPVSGQGDVLLIQEGLGEELPGNLKFVIGHPELRTKVIACQDESAYERLSREGVKGLRLERLGFAYPFVSRNRREKHALVMTNSDEIMHLEKIVSSLPDVRFSIGAVTEMSQRLMAMARHENVTLYPNVRREHVDRLFDECDVYLDINRHGEILDSVYQAFLHGQLVMGFEGTLHNKAYVAGNFVFGDDEPEKLIGKVREVMDDPGILDLCVAIQKEAAMSAGPGSYRRVLGSSGQ